jgi:hypothetical protein
MRETWGSTLMMYKSVITMVTVGIGITVLGFMWVQWVYSNGRGGWDSNGFVAGNPLLFFPSPFLSLPLRLSASSPMLPTYCILEDFGNCSSYQILLNEEDYKYILVYCIALFIYF